MASVTPPYFFDEYLRPITRKQPTERERALGLTLKDIDWLSAVYTATDSGRQAGDLPMSVETLALERPGQTAIALAGTFMMSPSPAGKKAVLYTPYAGMEVFDNREACLEELTQRLKDPVLRLDLIRFLSIAQRSELLPKSPFTLTALTLKNGVFEEQEKAIKANQTEDMQHVLRELRTIPTLAEMLEVGFEGLIEKMEDFKHLKLKDTRVNSFSASKDDNGNGVSRWVGSASLSDTLLQYYVKQAWPTGQTRTFSNPRHDKSGFTEAQHKQDQTRWETLVQQAAGILAKLLSAALQSWWNEPIGKDKSAAGQSRMDLFTQAMSDKFREGLLFKRQDDVVTSEQARRLLAIFLPDQAARSAWHKALRIETVKIHAPYQHYVQLAATLLIIDEHAYLYTQSRGLQVLKDAEDLNDTLLSMLKAAGHRDELLNFLSLDERSLYLNMRDVQVSGLPVEGGVFWGMVNDIYDKQLSNLEYALTQFRRSEGTVDLNALLDCSLDIRQMLDSRLLSLDAEGRWSLHPISSGNGRPSTVQAERAKLQLQALQTDESILIAQRAKHPTLRSLATEALNEAMAKHYLDLDAADVFVNTYPTEAQDREERVPDSSVNMVDHFIQRLANATGAISSTPRLGFYGSRHEGAALSWNSLNSRIFNDVITQTVANFTNHNVRAQPRRFLKKYGEEMAKCFMHGLRSEAELRLLNNTLGQTPYAILDTVLRADSMTRVKRHGLHGFLPDAFGLTVTTNADKTPQPLASCFVLTERGGLDPLRSGEVVLWTPQLGYEAFPSLTALRDALKQRLAKFDRRNALLENLRINLRLSHQTYQLGPLQRIDGHLLENRQQSYLTHHLATIDYWLAMPLGPKQLQDRLDDEMQRVAPSNIDRAKAIANTMIQQQALPAWLGMASPMDQLRHAELLEQYRLSAPDNQDYLHSLPTLREHVADALTALLKTRFPDTPLDPENILIPARVALNGHTQSLTDFALRHLPDLEPDNLTPQARDTTALPATLDGSAVVQLVRQLDIGKTYRELLKTHLTADTEDARKRRELFCQQLPWQVLRHAHEETLEERLSPSGWGFVQQIFDMPDAVARDAVTGATAMIRPLELIATAGATPAKVLGVYVIGPRGMATGPSLLYAPYAPFSVLKEYGSEEKLQDAINVPGPLQDWVLRQMGDPDQATFRNLFKQPQSPKEKEEEEKEKEEKVSLASNPIRGNLLRQLFHDNAEQLIKMLSCQFDKAGKHLWDGVTSLLRKGVPMALQFIAGKLKYPLVVWRSFKLFKASAEALQEQRFGEGLHIFIQGLAQIASLREQLDEVLPSDAKPAPPAPSTDPDSPVPAITADTLDVTEPQRTRMRRFEDMTVALTDMQLDPNSHVYTQPVNNRSYVPVGGRVYPVARSGNRWRVSLAPELGPLVERNAQGQWVLDLSEREPHFGPTLSRVRGRVITRQTVREAMNIEAAGMPAIRGLDWEKGLCIDRGLNLAIGYTQTCRRNLLQFALHRDPDSRVGLFLSEMFGLIKFSPEQVEKVLNRVREVLDGLTEQSLVTLDSSRFVMGAARGDAIHAFAFTVPKDVERKIYLLDLFFNSTMQEIYGNHLNLPFGIGDHARAATLIHEVSHIVSKTEDYAYLDSMTPYLDLISRGTPDGQKLYTKLEQVQSTAFSVLTPATVLFKTWDALADRWNDIGDTGSVKARDKILHLTGAKTLDDARQRFMSDVDRRIDIILANADSVTFLITHLGRESEPGA